MSVRLQAELKQTKPFPSVEEAVFLSVLRTADHLTWGEIEVLKVADLTLPQYNVLRILRGAEPVSLAHALLKLFVFTLPGTAAFFAQHGFPRLDRVPRCSPSRSSAACC
jgi:N-acetylglutamate synthase-like GNAT family acetyltransferase